MMKRQTLQALKRATRSGRPPDLAGVHALIDHGLEALDDLEGGASTIKQREELRGRERQVKLALADLNAVLHEILDTVPGDLEPAVVDGEPLIRDLRKAVLISELIDQMLSSTGPQWHREWAWYAPRVEEEFTS